MMIKMMMTMMITCRVSSLETRRRTGRDVGQESNVRERERERERVYTICVLLLFYLLHHLRLPPSSLTLCICMYIVVGSSDTPPELSPDSGLQLFQSGDLLEL